MDPLLYIRSLRTHFYRKTGVVKAVNGVDLSLYPGETVALVGESGSGKTVTALSILGLVPPPGKIVNGSIYFRGMNLRELSSREMATVRGKQIGFVLQDSASALNPVKTVGEQVAEVLRYHLKLTRSRARQRTLELLEQVQLPNVEQMYRSYPHQLSGGMRQRVLIAIALACKPALVIADEPTSSLDVSIQSQILFLLEKLKREFNLALLLITHDLGIVARMARRVAVMYAGEIVEEAPVRQLFTHPQHPYTEALLGSIPRIEFPEHASSFIAAPLSGSVPDPMNLPPGCVFHPRCPLADRECRSTPPERRQLTLDHSVKCLKRGTDDDRTAASQAASHSTLP